MIPDYFFLQFSLGYSGSYRQEGLIRYLGILSFSGVVDYFNG